MTEPLDAARIFAPAERTVAVMLQARAKQHSDKPLVQAGEKRWTFSEALDLAARSAGRLQSAGIRAGDRVALICENRPEFIEVFLGAAWLGAVLVPINTASRGGQLRHILQNSGARLLVIEEALKGSLDHVGLDSLPLEKTWTVEALPPLGEPAEPAPIRPSDTLAILYTSGTTGPSKGVCCPHAQFYWWGTHSARFLELRRDDVLCTTLPLFHTNALNTFFQALITGAAAIFEPRFSASAFWTTLAERGATVAIEPRFSASGFWPAMARARASVAYLLGAMVAILLARAPCAEER
ncbi:MAG: AMP-binding protein, partial [Alphaproteobacteria bacterium]|nr:AMP-binding protein [Alphaproteobacteria bacterium]